MTSIDGGRGRSSEVKYLKAPNIVQSCDKNRNFPSKYEPENDQAAELLVEALLFIRRVTLSVAVR